MDAVLSEIGTVKNMKAPLFGEVSYGVYFQELKTFNPQYIHMCVGL